MERGRDGQLELHEEPGRELVGLPVPEHFWRQELLLDGLPGQGKVDPLELVHFLEQEQGGLLEQVQDKGGPLALLLVLPRAPGTELGVELELEHGAPLPPDNGPVSRRPEAEGLRGLVSARRAGGLERAAGPVTGLHFNGTYSMFNFRMRFKMHNHHL